MQGSIRTFLWGHLSQHLFEISLDKLTRGLHIYDSIADGSLHYPGHKSNQG